MRPTIFVSCVVSVCHRPAGKICLLGTLAGLLLSTFSTAYAAPPDAAGQAMREMQRQPELAPPKVTAPLRLEEDVARHGTDEHAVRILIKSVQVSGNRAFPAGVLAAMLADLLGAEHTLSEWEAGLARITAWYRKHGYAVARAYLPEQEIKDGVIVVRVLEGLLGQARVVNQARLSDEHAHGYLFHLKSGDAVQEQPVNRALLLLSDVSGVGGARATLQPGASVGTSDLIVQLDPTAPYTADVELDNYGNRYTGENRLGAALALNSPLKLGDQFSVRVLESTLNMQYARIAYQLPVGGDGLKIGGAYSDTRYYLGKEFMALHAQGTASSTSLYATYPFIRSQLTNLYGTLTWERKALVDQSNVPLSTASKQVQLFNLGVMGKHQDATGITVLDTSLVSGKLTMDAALLTTDALSAHSNGGFVRLSYTLSRLQQLSEQNSLSLVISGQQSNTNLNSSEKFSLGGANGVRAYPQGEGVGDQGWMANLEMRRALMETVQGVAFYDMGAVQINRNPFNAAANSRTLAGIGLGLNAQSGTLQFKASVAWRTQGGQPLTDPAFASRNQRIWLQVSGQF